MGRAIARVLLVMAVMAWAASCSGPTEESRQVTDVGNTAASPSSEPRAVEEEAIEESVEMPMAEWSEELSENDVERDSSLRQLDSALASDDEEAVLDLMLDLEEQGGRESVEGLEMVIERALEEDLKLHALASVYMLADDEDVSDALTLAIEDPSAEVRLEALGVIEDAEMVNLIPVLRSMIREENDPEVVQAYDDTLEELEYVQSLESY